MKVVVTGSSGFIGTRLCELLAADERVTEVVGIDVAPASSTIPKVRTVERDVARQLDDLFDGAAAAAHLAWVLGTTRGAARMTAVNLGGTQRFLAACARAAARRVLLVSSATAYGAWPTNPIPLRESHPIDPAQPFQYAREKAVMEGLAREFATARPETTVVVVRPCIVVGPHVANYISRALAGPVLTAIGRSDPPWQFLHEDDAAAAMARLLLGGPPGTYNLGPPGTLTTRAIAARTGAHLWRVPYGLARRVGRLGWWLGLVDAPPEILDFFRWPWVVDGSKVCEAIGFRYVYDSAAAFDAFWRARSGGA